MFLNPKPYFIIVYCSSCLRFERGHSEPERVRSYWGEGDLSGSRVFSYPILCPFVVLFFEVHETVISELVVEFLKLVIAISIDSS